MIIYQVSLRRNCLKMYDTSLNTIKSWIKRYGWSKLKKERGAPSKVEGAPSVVPVKEEPGRTAREQECDWSTRK